MTDKIDWIAVDWGTSNMRAWAMGTGGVVRDHATSDKGMGALAPEEFEPELLRTIAPWCGEDIPPVVACGMVGARQGWAEAPYSTAPCTPLETIIAAPCKDPRLHVRIIGGISQENPSADVMRGEETQIAGLLAVDPDFDGVACLPGTHTKWVRVSAGEVCFFQTYMTGESFALLSGQSVLRHSLSGEGWDAEAFAASVDDVIARPQLLASRLFGIRAEALLQGLTPATARARLSGMLIGIELAAARSFWLGQRIAIVGDDRLAELYAEALQGQGAPSTRHDASELTLAGLRQAQAKWREGGAD